jgi:hypothetical protein
MKIFSIISFNNQKKKYVETIVTKPRKINNNIKLFFITYNWYINVKNINLDRFFMAIKLFKPNYENMYPLNDNLDDRNEIFEYVKFYLDKSSIEYTIDYREIPKYMMSEHYRINIGKINRRLCPSDFLLNKFTNFEEINKNINKLRYRKIYEIASFFLPRLNPDRDYLRKLINFTNEDKNIVYKGLTEKHQNNYPKKEKYIKIFYKFKKKY